MNNSLLYKYRKPIIITIVVFLILLITIPFFILVHESAYSATIELEVTPESAVILLDSQPITLNEESLIKTTPGSHTIAVIKDGYFAEGEEFYVSTDQVYSIEFNLVPFIQESVKE